jgi:quaternary ammonium compound-resistance protein SugE
LNWIFWGYLLLAALFEAAWTYCLKWMRFKDLKQLNLTNIFTVDFGLKILTPFFGYIIFGVLNVFLFSLATRRIPLATAFAVWMGASLLLIKLGEVLFFQQRTSNSEIFFMLMIMLGVIGLKMINVDTV